MKLLLHWLRWDLRRFRWPLLAWVALLAAFTAFVWYLNAHLLTVDRRLLDWPEGMGAVLGLMEVFILLPILSSDPASGTQPFWKTRPPAGLAVAAAKSVLVLTFFLLLPLIAWWLVLKACGFDSEQGRQWGGKTWMEFIWWAEALTISVLALAAAAARSTGHTIARILAGFTVLMVPVFLWMPHWESDSPTARLMERAAKAVIEGAFNIRAPWLWLAAGMGVFLAARRSRTPATWALRAPLVLPLLVIIAGSFIPEKDRFLTRDPDVPTLPAETVAALKIGEPLFSEGITCNFWQSGPPDLQRRSECVLLLRLRLSGLSEDRIAAASWRRLKLVADDGKELPVPPENLNRLLWREPRRDMLPVTGFSLSTDLLAPFSLTSCRAEGILSVTVERRREMQIPRETGALIERSDGLLMLTDASGLQHPNSGGPLFDITAASFRREGMHSTFLWLEHPLESERRLWFAVRDRHNTNGYFMHLTREEWRAELSSMLQTVGHASVMRAERDGTLADWRLKAGWYEPEGTVELPVVLNHFFVPRQPGDDRKAEDIVATLRITPDMTAAAVERTVKFALKLPALTSRIPEGAVTIARPPETHPFMAALTRFLDTVPPVHLPALLHIAEEHPGASSAEPPWDRILQSRIAAMMDAESVRQLREQNPQAFSYIQLDLARCGLIPAEEARQSSYDRMSDESLLTTWRSQEGKYASTYFLVTGPLQQALQRGLPWAPAELAELADLVPNHISPSDLLGPLSKLSDCPADAKLAMPWLQKNAAHLKWDAAAKRWVLP